MFKTQTKTKKQQQQQKNNPLHNRPSSLLKEARQQDSAPVLENPAEMLETITKLELPQQWHFYKKELSMNGELLFWAWEQLGTTNAAPGCQSRSDNAGKMQSTPSLALSSSGLRLNI